MRRALTLILLATLLVTACRREDGGTAGAPEAAPVTGAPAPAAPEEAATAIAPAAEPPAPVAMDEGPPIEGPMPESGPPMPGGGAAGSDIPELPDSPEERLARADQLIREMMAAYRSATYFTDRIEAVGTFGGQATPRSTFDLAFGAGADALLASNSNQITAVDGSLYVTFTSVPDRYLRFDLVDNMLTSLQQNFGGVGGVTAQTVLRYSNEPAMIVGALAFGLPPTIRISGYRVIKDLDGRQLEQLSLVSVAGSTTVNVDPQTKFIVAADVEYIDLNAPVGNFRVTRHLEFDPKVHDALPEPIAFVPGERMQVDTRAQLMGRWAPGEPVKLAVEVGDMAPDFTVHTLVGEKTTLNELRGTPVVLGFWSNNNVASRAAIGRLEEMYDYVTETKEWPMRVLAVHVRGKADADKTLWESVWELWERGYFKVPCLFDVEGEIADAFGVTVLPFWAVLDAEGRIVAVQGGFQETSMTAVLDVLRGMMKETE